MCLRAAGMYMKGRKRETLDTVIKRSDIRRYRAAEAVVRRLILMFGIIGMLNLSGCASQSRPMEKKENWSFQSAGAGDFVGMSEAGMSEDTSGERYTEDTPDIMSEADVSEPVTDEETVFGYVYLCGAVSAPGVYEIQDGMRVFEVIALAGGLTDEADAEWVNQARTVTDGEQIQIYTCEETAQMREKGITPENHAAGAAASGVASGSTEKTEDKININTADRELLMTLPGIGEAKADAILKYRETHGGFSSIGEICQISGIKDAVFSNIKDRISIQD